MLISIGLSFQYFVLRYLLVNATKVLQLTCELDRGIVKEYERQCEKFIQNAFVPFNQAAIYYQEMNNQYMDNNEFKQVDIDQEENELQINRGNQPKNNEIQEVKQGNKKKRKVIRADLVNKRKAQVVKDMYYIYIYIYIYILYIYI